MFLAGVRRGCGSVSVRRFTAVERAERNEFLKTKVYKRWWEADEDRKRQLERTGELFSDYWQLFRSRAADHEELLADNRYAKRLPRVYRSRPFRIAPSLASRLTAASCRLEGSTMTVQDVHDLNVDAGMVDKITAAQLPAPSASRRLRSTREVNEAYYHVVALYYGQKLTLHRPDFYVSGAELLSLHSVLMRPFTDKTPGVLRGVPIHVSNWHTAYFPFPKELPSLTERFSEWLRAPPEGTAVHPFLRACDIFLVMAHLHPFMDGNGRMSRLLASLAMAHGGCQPTVFDGVPREKYCRAVHAAQHEHRVCDFYRFCLDHALPKSAQT
jgi:Fic family protein